MTEPTQPHAVPSGPDLRADFPPHSLEDWRRAAEELLQGKPFDKVLLTRLPEGFDVQPLYRREDLAGLPHLGDLPGGGSRVRGSTAAGCRGRPWLISQELCAATPEEAGRAVPAALARGQTELNLPLDQATRSGQDPDVAAVGLVGIGGLSLTSLADLEKVLAGVDLRKVSLYLRAGSSGLPVAALLAALAESRGVARGELRGCVEMDPLASLARRGEISVTLACAYREMALLARWAEREAPCLQTIGVQSHPYHDGGAHAVQELGFVLATAVDYARVLQERGLGLGQVAPRLRFAFSVGPNFFLEIAKLRAARLLWSQVVDAWGGPEEARQVHLHARTGLFNKSRLDPHTNLLRTTSEAFAAVVGGCDSLHVGPFDEAFQTPDEFSARIARNTHFILGEESGLDQVIDPAGGAYFVECLTDRLARSAWSLFQQIEGMGGMARALAAGWPQAEVAKVAESRRTALARRREALVGVNQYPNGRERLTPPRQPDPVALRETRARQVAAARVEGVSARHGEVMTRLAALLEAPEEAVVAGAIAAAAAGASLGEISRTLRGRFPGRDAVAAIPAHRLAQDYEELRAGASAYAARQGHPPRLLQVNYGPSRNYRARADWTTAFFQTGGFEVLADRDFRDPAEAVAALRAIGANLAILVAPDEAYAEAVPTLAAALKAAVPGLFLLVAGAPGEQEAAWRAAGVDDFVHVRVGNYELNRKLLQQAGALSA